MGEFGQMRGIRRFGVLSLAIRLVFGDRVCEVELYNWVRGQLHGERDRMEVVLVEVLLEMLEEIQIVSLWRRRVDGSEGCKSVF